MKTISRAVLLAFVRLIYNWDSRNFKQDAA